MILLKRFDPPRLRSCLSCSAAFICRSINRDTKSQLGEIRVTTDAPVITHNAMTVKKSVPWARFVTYTLKIANIPCLTPSIIIVLF